MRRVVPYLIALVCHSAQAQDPPPVQMLVPGFTVRELPVKLPNVNNVICRPDGKLYALAYDANIYLLSDTDGDGLHDHADLFFEHGGRHASPVGIDLTPDGFGVFVALKGAVLLIEDKDHDGKAESERVLATGWQPARTTVDTTGIARDPRTGEIYFGLGVRQHDNAYEIDESGKAHNQLQTDRGTIQKLSADYSKRETVCTGIRWPIALRFHRSGALFCTDQEGATWLANGNPFDELLHIQPGRHYGFPPRHPKHLPNVIDEPSVFDFSPQHQSACGMNWNLPPAGAPPNGPVFGPESWRGEALVIGESRGKLWRVRLTPTDGPANGWVARSELIACLNRLAIDVCLTQRGDAIICTHSGGPDWGTGPKGEGALYHIRYTERELPQPVAAWVTSNNTLRVAFDRAAPAMRSLDPKAVVVEAGRNVRAGDRFEHMRPSFYEVLQRHDQEARRKLPVRATELSIDNRELLITLATAIDSATPLAISLPGMDLGTSTAGVEAQWSGEDGMGWSGWLPHPDLAVSRELTRGSLKHEAFWKGLKAGGVLTLTTQLDLWRLLRPAIQEGSALDYEYQPEEASVTFASPSGPMVLTRGNERKESTRGHVSHDLTFGISPTSAAYVPIELVLTIDEGAEPELRATWSTAEDKRPRAFPLRRFILPGFSPPPISSAAILTKRPEIQGGSWSRGKELFFGETALCSKCHTVRGQGGQGGPDLSNVTSRDYTSLLRDLKEPSAVINPEYIAQEIDLADGTKLVGTMRLDGADDVIITQGAGVERRVAKDAVKSQKPLAISLMPAGLDVALGAEGLRDLMTFLLTEPPLMGVYSSWPRDDIPAPANPAVPHPRTKAEIAAALAGADARPADGWKKRQVVLVAGPKDHGVGEHDYPRWQRVWGNLLSLAENLDVATAWEWPTIEQLKKADALVFFRKGDWSDARAKDLDAFLARGGGVTFLHWAVEGGEQVDGLARRLGLAGNAPLIKYRHGRLDLTFPGQHPITRNYTQLQLHDESYWELIGDVSRVQPLMFGVEAGQPRPLFWVREEGPGRLCGCILGHYNWTFDDPLARILIFRGIAWTMKDPIDRFAPLVEAGW